MVQFRPLAAIGAPGSSEDEIRSQVGHESYDAAELAQHFSVAMLADDLGLRCFMPKGSPGRSFSSVTLLPRLAEEGKIATDRANELLLELIERRYTVIVPTRPLLVAAAQRSGDNSALTRAFALLAERPLDLAKAASIAAEVIRATAIQPVQTIDVVQVTRLSLQALTIRWPPLLAASALVKAAGAELMFLPTAFEAVRKVITTYVRAQK
jgi:hypothetical protein